MNARVDSLRANAGKPVAHGECSYCGSPIRFPGLARISDSGPVCESAHCRMLADRQKTMTASAFRRLVSIRALQAREQRERDLAAARRLEQRLAAEAVVNEALWRSLARQPDADPAAQYPRLLVPSGPRRTTNLPQWRRNRYRDHLNRIIAEAARRDSPDVGDARNGARDVESPPASSAIAQRLCALCGGGCCTRGAESAYLSAATIRRYMREHPGQRPRQVLEAYLDRVAYRTEAGSCVNHGENGCTLPREMRSDVCNNYCCAALREWQQRSRGEPPPRGALVIVRRRDNWMKDHALEGNEVVCAARIGDDQPCTVGSRPAGSSS